MSLRRYGIYRVLRRENLTHVQLGLCIEPTAIALQEMSQLEASRKKPLSLGGPGMDTAMMDDEAPSAQQLTTISQRLMAHLNNYILSFGTSLDVNGRPSVPLKLFQVSEW